MKVYTLFLLLTIFFLDLQAQEIYTVSFIKGTVTNDAGKKIAIGSKIKTSDKIIIFLQNQQFNISASNIGPAGKRSFYI